MKRFLLRHRLTLSVALAFFIVVAIVTVSLFNTERLLDAGRWVAHTHQVVSTLDQTLGHVEAAEAAQRGFVITGQEVYAESVSSIRRMIRRDLNELRDLVQDDPVQQQRFEELSRRIDRKLDYIDRMVALRRRDGFDGARQVSLGGGGRSAMAAVAAQIDAMLRAERRLLTERNEISQARAQRTMLVLWTGTAIDLLLMGAIVILVIRDFERRAELNRALAVARDSALRAAEVRSQFLANMSHEIRTPLNAIIGMSSLLVTTELDDDQRDLANTVRTAADALLTIINDILDFSKIEAGKLLIEEVDFEVGPTIESVIDLFSEVSAKKNLEIGVLLDHDIPTIVRGDAGRIRQVLTNLVGNAVKFTNAGEVIVNTNLIRTEERSLQVRFSVTDTGIGMSADVVSLLFQPFSQADASTTREYGGTGLGLAISKQLVELMDGTIDVDSAPEKGSTFSFTIPILKTAAREAEDRFDLRGLHVLVVGDNNTHRRLLRHSLEAWKMESEEVGSGVQALALLREAAGVGEPYRVAIVDMLMPEMDGLALSRAIKGDPSIANTRLIMVTSMADRLDPELVRDGGFEASLTKPVKQSALFDAIVTVVAGRQQVKRSRQPRPSAPAAARGDLRVLVAEDNPVNQKLAVRQLKRLGIEADAVVNGLEALEALSRTPYDLVLMDCQMPRMDGFEATRQIRLREGHVKHTPIVALTANALQGDRDRCLDAGMDDYLAKPVSEIDLASALERWLPTAEPKGRVEPVEAKTIAYLRQLGGADENFLHDLIVLYIDDAALRLSAIRAAIESGDPTELTSAAHALMSSAGNIGAMEVRAIAETIEQIGLSGSIDGAPAAASRLEAEHARAVECLRSYES